jgi:hypothetical protein
MAGRPALGSHGCALGIVLALGWNWGGCTKDFSRFRFAGDEAGGAAAMQRDAANTSGTPAAEGGKGGVVSLSGGSGVGAPVLDSGFVRGGAAGSSGGAGTAVSGTGGNPVDGAGGHPFAGSGIGGAGGAGAGGHAAGTGGYAAGMGGAGRAGAGGHAAGTGGRAAGTGGHAAGTSGRAAGGAGGTAAVGGGPDEDAGSTASPATNACLQPNLQLDQVVSGCRDCACDHCAEVVLSCLADDDEDGNPLCAAFLRCALVVGCHDWDCYCDSSSCLASVGVVGDGPCVSEMNAAAGGTKDHAAVRAAHLANDSTSPLVRAVQAIGCSSGEPSGSAVGGIKTGMCMSECLPN